MALAVLLQAAPVPPAQGDPPETRFSSEVEVVARRALSVEDVLARHRLAADRQAARLPSWIASGSTTVLFQAPGIAAPMSVTSETTVFAGPGVLEIEYRDIRLNGAAVPLGRDAVPRLPIIEPERAAATPLALLLDHRYRYRLGDPDRVDGHPCYVVLFEPAVAGLALHAGPGLDLRRGLRPRPDGRDADRPPRTGRLLAAA